MDKKMEFLDNISSYENEQKYDRYFKAAKSGNDKSAIVLGLLNKYNIYVASANEITEGRKRGAIILMKRLMEVDDPVCQEMAKKLAEKFELDVLQEGENGTKTVDKSKLDEITREKVGKFNDSYLNSDKDRYDQMNFNIIRTTKDTLANQTSIKEYLQYSEDQAKQFAGRVQFNQMLISKEKFNGGMQRFVQEYPNTARKLLTDRAEMIKVLQQNQKVSLATINQKQNNLILLSNMASPIIKNKENQRNIPEKFYKKEDREGVEFL